MYRHCLILCAVALMMLAACDTTAPDPEPEPVGPAPELLTVAAFSMNADLFRPGSGKGAAAKLHYANAALRVWPVSAILSANLVIPVAVTGAALQATPVFEGGVWHWRQTAAAEGATFTFDLAATPRLSGIDWSMRVTSSRAVAGETYNGFELYTATTALDGQSGSWRLNYQLGGVSTNVLNADFQLLAGGAKELTYTLGDGLDQAGDTVRYTVAGNDRGFLWTQLAAALTHDVAWNAVTRQGGIIATNYQNGVEGCWDETLEDMACP